MDRQPSTLQFKCRPRSQPGPRTRQRPLKAFYSPIFELPLPAKHRFPMAKYRLLHDRVHSLTTDGGIQLLPADPVKPELLLRVHDAAYVERALTGELSVVEMRRIGFPWSEALIDRSSRSVGATVQAARAALTDGVGVNLAGGTHHAGKSRGQGFCVFNDVAVAIRELQASGCGTRCAVIDCDVHQGNGTAEIFAQDPDVLTISLHGERNFPFSKFPSDIDVPLPDGIGDEDYLNALRTALAQFDLAGFDCAFYIAGADPFQGDRLGRLSLTQAGLRERDELVLRTCNDAGVPVAVAMAGGYATDVNDIVEIHATTIQVAAQIAMSNSTETTEPRI